MAKLAILLATAFAALLLVDASIYRATVVIEDEANPRGQDCRQQFEQQQRLKHCQDFMWSKKRQSQREVNPEEHLQMCCDQLRNMDSICVCDSLGFAMWEMEQAGQEMRGMEIRGAAEQIPSMCQMPQGRCQFGQPSISMY